MRLLFISTVIICRHTLLPAQLQRLRCPSSSIPCSFLTPLLSFCHSDMAWQTPAIPPHPKVELVQPTSVASHELFIFTTVFNVFTTDFHFFTTPPSILTTPPSILTTLLCSLRSEICCYLGLGRHAAHKIKISGDALTVSAPNICPSTTTVGTPYVRVICTGAASQSACPVVTAGI
jgi:hypothetical protein